MLFLNLVICFAAGFLLTIGFYKAGERYTPLKKLGPYQAAILAALLTGGGFLAVAVLNCDSDCGLFFPLLLGMAVTCAVAGLAGASIALAWVLGRQQK